MTSFKRIYASTPPQPPGLSYSVPLTLWQATVSPRLHQRHVHRQVWLCLLWGHCSFLLGPGAQVLFVLSRSLFPQSCGSSVIKFYWPPKSSFPGGSQSLCQILRLGNLFWTVELLQQCENFFLGTHVIIVVYPPVELTLLSLTNVFFVSYYSFSFKSVLSIEMYPFLLCWLPSLRSIILHL